MSCFPQGYERRVLQVVDSTLDEARRVAGSLSGPTWILALQQSAARGRRGRAWQMPLGNFAATLVLPETRPDQAALRSFVVSLALRQTCVALSGRDSDFELKWPNDVLLRGGKLAGILLESIGIAGAVSHVAIGVGVNLAAAPDAADLEAEALRPVSMRGALGVHVAPEDFLDHLAEAYAQFEDQFSTYGFAPIRVAWLEHAARLGQVITARTGNAVQTGTFVDVDATGQLVLETPKGRTAIPAADVYF